MVSEPCALCVKQEAKAWSRPRTGPPSAERTSSGRWVVRMDRRVVLMRISSAGADATSLPPAVSTEDGMVESVRAILTRAFAEAGGRRGRTAQGVPPTAPEVAAMASTILARMIATVVPTQGQS